MRIDHWEIALESLVDSQFDAEFVWGEHDCCMWTANCVQAITGIDIAEAYRGKYSDQSSAFALIAEVTGVASDQRPTVEDTMDHAIQSHEFIAALPSVYFAHRGDVVSLKIGDDITLGVVGLRGTHAWFTGGVNDPENSILLEVPISKCNRAWSIR